jgi:uncharacterized protein YfeS
MSEYDKVDYWQIDREHAHPKARSAFRYEFLWQSWNDYGPFGNDDGHPVFADFRKWRGHHPNSDPLEFLHHLHSGWGVKIENVLTTEPHEVRDLLKKDRFSLHTYDQTVIALGFAQIYVEGVISQHIKELVLAAIERQSLSEVVEDMWVHSQERLEHLKILKSIILEF